MKRTARAVALFLVPLSLAGCVNDTASYMIDGNRHDAITLIRTQKWFWEDKVILSVVAGHQPECLGGMEIRNVPGNQPIVLHRAPDEFPEPIYILVAGGGYYAVSTTSCQVQKFQVAPTDLGPVIGSFKTVDGKFKYIPAGN